MFAASEQPVDRRYGRSGYRDSAAAAGPDDEQRSADHHMPWRWLGTAAASKPLHLNAAWFAATRRPGLFDLPADASRREQ